MVVLGATGVTGRRVAAYLAGRAQSAGVRWAVAARDAGRAHRQLAEIGVAAPETLVADVGDPASLRRLAGRTRVVLDVVGPYTLYGAPVIEACVQSGAHYVDLTGEIPFVRRMIDAHDAAARAAGVKIVQVCGFESLPPDLAIAIAAETARERWQEPLASVEVQVTITPPPGAPRPSDMISGGTLQSLFAVAAGEGAETIADPAALVPEDGAARAVRAASPITLVPKIERSGAVIAPMAPAPFINPAVIHRTAVVADIEAGRAASPFRYREGVVIGGSVLTLPLRAGMAGAMAGTQVALRGFARTSRPLRSRIVETFAHLAPGSGYGPAAGRLEAWRWTLAVRARTGSGRELRVDVDADGHPGYLATARMLGEAGVLLCRDGLTPARAGCLTPALALGTASAPSFEHAKVRFSLRSGRTS